MIKPIITPEEQERRTLLANSTKTQLENLRKRLQIRLETAIAQRNQDLIRQLEEELNSLK